MNQFSVGVHILKKKKKKRDGGGSKAYGRTRVTLPVLWCHNFDSVTYCGYFYSGLLFGNSFVCYLLQSWITGVEHEVFLSNIKEYVIFCLEDT